MIVNPYDIEATAAAIARAFTMPIEERKDRWNAMMTALRANTIHDWTTHFLQALGNEAEGAEFDHPLSAASPRGVADIKRSDPRPAPPVWTALRH